MVFLLDTHDAHACTQQEVMVTLVCHIHMYGTVEQRSCICWSSKEMTLWQFCFAQEVGAIQQASQMVLPYRCC